SFGSLYFVVGRCLRGSAREYKQLRWSRAQRAGVGVPIERRAPAECSASMRGEAGETLNFRPILTVQRMERRMLLIAIVGVAEIRNCPMAKCEVISRTP